MGRRIYERFRGAVGEEEGTLGDVVVSFYFLFFFGGAPINKYAKLLSPPLIKGRKERFT